MHLWERRPDDGPHPIQLHKDKRARRNTQTRINKPMKFKDNKQELITNHRKVYSEFVESIDFDQLQQDEQ